MNISKIRKLILEGDMSSTALLYLLDCRCECEYLDYKLMIDFNLEHDAISITKDIIAMKNIGGGYIIIGVKDKTWEKIGVSSSFLLDTAMLRDKVRKYSNLEIETDIVFHDINSEGKTKKFGLILIRGKHKLSKLKKPSICKKSCQKNEDWGIREGDIYIRDGDSTKKLVDLEVLYEKIEELEYRNQEDEAILQKTIPSPFAIESGFFRLLPKEYGSFIGRDTYKSDVKDAVVKDPRIWIVNLHGPGGVGKSALATWIAYRFYEEKTFEAILHLSAKDQELSTEFGIRHLKPTLISLEDLLDKILCLFEHNEYCSEELSIKKKTATELLCAWKTLLILDNMETVRDGRIMEFVREFPPSNLSKVLLTSRKRTSGWEFSIPVKELSENEVEDFISSKSLEMNIEIPKNKDLISKIATISGGLPLAIQWMLGEYASTKDIFKITNRVVSPDSPLLEFSFRNSWDSLDRNAKLALSVLSLLDEPPTTLVWRSILDWTNESMEKAISALEDATFVTEHTDQRTGEKTYRSLPITLSFAKNELPKFGDLGARALSRYKEYIDRIALASEDTNQCEGLFVKFQAQTDTQKKAILLCRMAEGQASTLGYEEAEEYYKQALKIDPRSIYAMVSYGKLKADLQYFDEGILLIRQAIPRITKPTGFYVFYNLADIYGRMKDWGNKVHFLNEALKYEDNTMAKHALGVAFGHLNQHKEAIEVFTNIIENEFLKQYGPNYSLIYAVNTKIISLRRMKREAEIIPFLNNIKARLSMLSGKDYFLNEIQTIIERNS